MMFRQFKRMAVTALAVSALISNTAFAAVLYAPGVSAAGGAGPVNSTSSVIDATEGVATAQVQAQQSQNQQTQTTSSVKGPTGSSGMISGGSRSGGGAAGTGVSADPILGETPLINAVMIDTNGNAEAPFSTDTGASMSTTEGFSGLWLCYDRAIGDVYYRVYTDEYGWSKWAMNEMITPNAGGGVKVRGVQIRTTGYTHNNYSIFYQATLNDGTTLGWAKDGQAAGAFGNGKYIQGLEIKLFQRGTGSAANYQQGAAYEGVVVGADGQVHYSTFDGRAYTGWAYDTDNNKYYFSNNNIVTGWQYIDGYKYYFDERGRVVTDLEPIIGVTKDYIIKINKSMKTMTIYGKDGNNGYIMPVKVILNTIGKSTPIGTFKTYEGYRWKYMHDAEGGAYYCQFLLRFKNGFLLHSIIYQGAADSYHLIADTYNMLGKNQSDGCVRMLSGDAAWVYNNCGVGTQVTIYEDDWTPGPFDRPAIEKAIPRTQNFDPTDPVIVANLQAAEIQAAAEAAAAANAEAATGVEAAPQEVDR